MRTEKTLFRIAATAFVVIVAAFAVALPMAAQQADFTLFAQIGDSLTAGFTDGCLVEYAQNDSYGAIIARHAGVSGFQQPLISRPGLGPCMYLKSLVPAPTFGPPPLQPGYPGTPTNLGLTRPYNNLGVPGYTISQAVDSNPTTPAGGLGFIILRGAGTMLEQAAALKPTFLTIYIGNNDVLNAAGLATVDPVIGGVTVPTMTPTALFDAKLQTIVDTMKAAQGGTGKGLILNIGDVAALPFTTTVSPIIGSNPSTTPPTPIYAYSNAGCPTGVPACPVPAGSLLTLYAAAMLQTGMGIPCALLDAAGAPANDPRRANCLIINPSTGALISGKPLPDNCDLSGGPATCSANPGVVLTPAEITALRTRTAAFNASIAARGPAAGYKLYDVAALFQDILAHGRTYGGLTVTTAYLQGGFFGYDGVHPTSLGYAILAQALIDFINASYGNSLDSIDMTPYLVNGDTSTGGFPPSLTLTPEESLKWAAEIYSPENWETSLKYMFTLPARHAVAPSESQDQPVRVPRGGTERQDGPQQ